MLLIGAYAPASFVQHFIVFALACFVGFQVIWNVSHSLHTPLMAVTNAISGIIIIGALLQLGSPNNLVDFGVISVLIATINIVGGFMVNPFPDTGDIPEPTRVQSHGLSENMQQQYLYLRQRLFILSLGIFLCGRESAKRAVWWHCRYGGCCNRHHF